VIGEYRHARRVNFYETDAAGIVHFSWYPRYMEEAEHALWRSVGLTIHERGGEIGWPRVALAFDYHAPLRFEDEFEAVIRIADIGRTSIRYTCDIVRGGERIASGSMTIVCVERRPGQTVRAVEIPSEVAACFQAAEPA